MTNEFTKLPDILESIGKWHPTLAEVIAEHMTSGMDTSQKVDEFLMTITKLVENRLQETLEEWTGGEVTVTGAFRLLSLAAKNGMVKEGDSFDHLAKWFFAEPRNTSHHEFQNQ